MTPGNDPVAERSARRSDAQFYVKRQGGGSGAPDFSVVAGLFLRYRKHRKIGKVFKDCSGQVCWTLG